MKWRYRLYATMMVLWIPLVVVGFALVETGQAAAYLPASLRQSSTETTALVAAGLALGGFLVFGWLRGRTWGRIAREAGLETDGSGSLITLSGGHGLFTLLTTPDLTGIVHGRPVRVSTHRVSTGSGEESGSETHTIVATDLDGPPEESAILTTGPDGSVAGVTGFGPGEFDTTTIDDNFTVLGSGDEAAARELLSGRARDRLRALDTQEGVVVGNPTDVLLDSLADEMGSFGGMMVDGLRTRLEEDSQFDPETVAISSEKRVLDPDELRAQAEAVAAVAEAVEQTTAEPTPA
ncbi:hypothetical protein ACKVMT_06370 [Halobacteriales archaeon Cl-PHB]